MFDLRVTKNMLNCLFEKVNGDSMLLVNKYADILLNEFYLDTDGVTVRRSTDGWGNRWKQDDKVEGYKLCSHGYEGVHIPKTRTTVSMTHLILLLRGIQIPDGMVVDHIDGNKLNNFPENLRIIPQALNTKNRVQHSNNTSGYTGITWSNSANQFMVRLTLQGKRMYLGCKPTLEEAIELRDSYNLLRTKDGYTSRHGLEGVTTIPKGSTPKQVEVHSN